MWLCLWSERVDQFLEPNITFVFADTLHLSDQLSRFGFVTILKGIGCLAADLFKRSDRFVFDHKLCGKLLYLALKLGLYRGKSVLRSNIDASDQVSIFLLRLELAAKLNYMILQ